MKNILITGASRGIGAAAARALSDNGNKIFVNYKTNREKAEALASEIGGTAVQADVSDSVQVKNMVSYINSLCGGIDVLINNAGIASFSVFDALYDEDWHNIINTNLSGAFYCIKNVLPHMIHQKSGCIINISSMWGITGASCEVAYSAAKAGLIGMTKALAKETGPSGIRVNCIAPGVIDTDMNSNLSSDALDTLKDEIPLCRIGTAAEVAEVIKFLTESGSYITGQVISPNGGMVI